MITLKKIEQVEAVVLKDFTMQFIQSTDTSVRKHEENYFGGLLKLDLSNSIFRKLRTKIENAKKGKLLNLTFSISEATILISVCQDKNISKNDFEEFVSNKTINQLHEQLINL